MWAVFVVREMEMNWSFTEISSDYFDCEGFVNGFNLSSRYVELDAGTDDFAQA